MITKLKAWLGRAVQNLNRIGDEPILAIGLGMIAFNTFQQASDGGLAPEDAAAAAVIAVLTALGRQLVYPATKVDANTGGLKPPALEKPWTGVSDD